MTSFKFQKQQNKEQKKRIKTWLSGTSRTKDIRITFVDLSELRASLRTPRLSLVTGVDRSDHVSEHDHSHLLQCVVQLEPAAAYQGMSRSDPKLPLQQAIID